MESKDVADEIGPIGVVGATSLIGGCLLRLIAEQNQSVCAFSRRPHARDALEQTNWYVLAGNRNGNTPPVPITHWIYVAPIWTLQEHMPTLFAMGARRIVAISSTSRFTKALGSSFADPSENAMAERIAKAEESLQRWARDCGTEWIILRPTLVYGFGIDKNISEIARFICRFRCFPILGQAQGLRQPIHADDVALAAMAALTKKGMTASALNIAGGETLTYTEMVSRIFIACKIGRKFIRVPRVLFLFAIAFLRRFPRYQKWNASMATRMNEDLAFECEDVWLQLGLSPRKFVLTDRDLPKM